MTPEELAGAAGFFATHLARNLGCLVNATDVAVFYHRRPDPDQSDLETIAYLRGGGYTEDQKSRALEAMKFLVTEGLKKKRGGYWNVGHGTWCLVVLLFDENRITRGTIAFAVRASDESEIERKMQLLKGAGVRNTDPEGESPTGGCMRS